MATAAKQVSRGGISGALIKVRSWPGRISSYYEGIKREMRLVTWPSQKEVQSTTVVVLVAVFAFALFFGVVDYILALGQARLYEFFAQ